MENNSESHTTPIDSILLLSFGGPEAESDVIPFLRNVTKGRNVPDERLAEVAEQYALFDGVSPLNQQCRELKTAIEAELSAADIDLPVFWGNRNWHPMLADTIEEMNQHGCKRSLVFVTSAFSSYSGCRQYREDLSGAADQLEKSPVLQKLRLFYNHPGFIEPLAENLKTSVAQHKQDSRIIFTAHSIPLAMAAVSDYEKQLHEACRLVLEVGGFSSDEYDLVFQSRSGPPHIPWLEPDVNDHLKALGEAGTKAVTVLPIGFTSDHMEVLFDLDTQAKQTAEELALDFVRVPTVGTASRYVKMIRQLIEEQLDGTEPLALGNLDPWPDQCPEGHCLMDSANK